VAARARGIRTQALIFARKREEGEGHMALRKYLVALLVGGSLLITAGAASAAFPNFSDCPTSTPGFEACLDVQGTSGNLRIKTFNVPLGESLEIRGGFANGIFTPPAGTTGFFARPVRVPGGLLGIEWLPGNSVLAITELAGSPSQIRIDAETLGLSVPVKVRLVNVLLGMDCHIGTNRNPVVLNLITGTTNPPPPNRPITGFLPPERFVPPNQIQGIGVVDVENSFAVPGATECGLGLGLINSLVNLKLGLPSAAGNNSIEVTNNIALTLGPPL
jgi:hypothetical protein